jgi:hypothetical protein
MTTRFRLSTIKRAKTRKKMFRHRLLPVSSLVRDIFADLHRGSIDQFKSGAARSKSANQSFRDFGVGIRVANVHVNTWARELAQLNRSWNIVDAYHPIVNDETIPLNISARQMAIAHRNDPTALHNAVELLIGIHADGRGLELKQHVARWAVLFPPTIQPTPESASLTEMELRGAEHDVVEHLYARLNAEKQGDDPTEMQKAIDKGAKCWVP